MKREDKMLDPLKSIIKTPFISVEQEFIPKSPKDVLSQALNSCSSQ